MIGLASVCLFNGCRSKKEFQGNTHNLHQLAIMAIRNAGLNTNDWTVSQELIEMRDSFWIRFQCQERIVGGYGYVIIDRHSLTATVRMGE